MNQISWHGYQTANRKDHSLYAIFLIYSIFSNRNQTSLFSRKAYDKLITITGKKRWDAHARWWAIAIFFNWQSLISKQILHVFNVGVQSAHQWRHKLCAVRMRNAKQGNDLKTISNWFLLLSTCFRNLKPFLRNGNRCRTLQKHNRDIINIFLTSSSRTVP